MAGKRKPRLPLNPMVAAAYDWMNQFIWIGLSFVHYLLPDRSVYERTKKRDIHSFFL